MTWLTVPQAELPFKTLEMYLYYPKGVDGPAGRVIVTEAGVLAYWLHNEEGLIILRRAEVESVEVGRRVVEMGGEEEKGEL